MKIFIAEVSNFSLLLLSQLLIDPLEVFVIARITYDQDGTLEEVEIHWTP